MRLFRNVLLACSLFAGSFTAFADPVDINHADAATIAAAMKGIGQKKAEAIVAYRKKNGPFKVAEDLIMVKGVGTKTVEDNRQNIRVGGVQNGK